MFYPMTRAIAGGAMLVMISACGGVSGSSRSTLPAMNPSSTRANGRLHSAASSGAPQPGTLFVAAAKEIIIFTTGGSTGSNLGLLEKGQITKGVSQPRVLATDATGDLFVGNAGDNTIEEYANGSNTPSATIKKIYQPQGLAVDAQGNIWVSQLQTPRDLFPVVDEYAYNAKSKTFSTRPTKTIVGSGPASLVFPHGLAFDSSGNLFIADTGHSGAVLEVKSGAATPTLVPLPALSQPSGAFPGVIVAPSAVAASGSHSNERLEISDFGTGMVTSLSLGATKPAWSLSLSSLGEPVNVLWCVTDSNGFSYALAFASGGSSTWDLVLVDPTGNIARFGNTEQVQQNIDSILGIAFTPASVSTAARTMNRRSTR